MSAEEFRRDVDIALDVYVRAMRYPPGTERARRPMWLEHTRRVDFTAVGAFAQFSPTAPEGSPARERLVGIGYGYRSGRDQWWARQIIRGLRAAGRSRSWTDSLLDDAFELTELHVHPDHQGRAVGAAILETLLRQRTERIALLSTPEVPNEANKAWHLYRHFGFTDVLRDFHFTGDARPFAVLGRTLPLPEPPVTDPGAAATP